MITPPTDSLYKFIAISGLLVLAWGVAYPWNKGLEYELKIAETKAEIRTAKSKSDSLMTTYDALEKEAANIDKEPASPKREAKESAIELRKQALYVQMIETQQPVDMRTDVLKVMEEALHSYKVMGSISIATGLLLTSLGFFLWYKRVQRYIDEDVQHHENAHEPPSLKSRLRA